MGAVQNRPRLRLANHDISTIVGNEIGEWVDKQPCGVNHAMRVFCERALQFADDSRARTGTRTWAGYDNRADVKKQLGRIKSVEGTIGTIIGCAALGEPRNTPTWVLDAIQYALGILRGTRITNVG